MLNFSGRCPINFIELSPKQDISDKYNFKIKTIYINEEYYLHYSNENINGEIIIELHLIYKNDTKCGDEINEMCISPKMCNYRYKGAFNECYYNWKFYNFSLSKINENNPEYIYLNNDKFPILGYRTYLGYKNPKAKDINYIIESYCNNKDNLDDAIYDMNIFSSFLSIVYLIALKIDKIKGGRKFDCSDGVLSFNLLLCIAKFSLTVYLAIAPLKVYKIYYKNVYTGDKFKFSKTRYAFGIIFTIISLIMIIYQFLNEVYSIFKKSHSDD